MMKTIAQNDNYVIAVDPSKNRTYLTLIGYWKSRAEVPKYIDDWKKAIKELSKGFTILSDVTRMKAPPQDVVQLHTEAQKVLMAGGLSKMAELVGEQCHHQNVDRSLLSRVRHVQGDIRQLEGS